MTSLGSFPIKLIDIWLGKSSSLSADPALEWLNPHSSFLDECDTTRLGHLGLDCERTRPQISWAPNTAAEQSPCLHEQRQTCWTHHAQTRVSTCLVSLVASCPMVVIPTIASPIHSSTINIDPLYLAITAPDQSSFELPPISIRSFLPFSLHDKIDRPNRYFWFLAAAIFIIFEHRLRDWVFRRRG